MGTRLFVGNLSYNVNEQALKEVFVSEQIEVRSVRIAMDRDTGKPRGFAFVETVSEEGAKQSIAKLGGRLIQGRPVLIEEAQARPAPGAPRRGWATTGDRRLSAGGGPAGAAGGRRAPGPGRTAAQLRPTQAQPDLRGPARSGGPQA